MSKVTLDAVRFPQKKLLEGALFEAVEADAPLVLELLFVSEADIRALNREKRGVDAVTDVLSFPAAALKAGEPVRAAEHPDCVELGKRTRRMYLGSVVICKKRAKEQAEEYGHSFEREVCYLAVHGFLHCLGYDHETEEERRVMRAREEEIMQKIGLGREQ